jgi:hypothetical protein
LGKFIVGNLLKEPVNNRLQIKGEAEPEADIARGPPKCMLLEGKEIRPLDGQFGHSKKASRRQELQRARSATTVMCCRIAAR